jgi:hypothetical protein
MAAVGRAQVSTAGLELFETHVRPVLAERCFECHSQTAKDLGGGLRLDSAAGLIKGGDSGPIVIPGQPDESPLVKAIRYSDPLLQMPPDGKLPQSTIDGIVEWIRLGAPDPRGKAGSNDRVTKRKEVNADWWSFQPIGDPSVPRVHDEHWPHTDIDRFVQASRESSDLPAPPDADRRTFIRRATFDLIGLPPTPDEIEYFLNDPSPDAHARLIDRLLASPHYGERWGRMWLDVVRYADTSGCNSDFPIPEAYRYRNYVIDSFNQDKPFDRFLKEQIAGDLLPAQTDAERFENIIGTGYLAISRRFSSLNEEFHLTLDDTVDNFGKAILGLSISCARCHEHKFDPIPQADYYALYGIFQSTRYAFPGTEIYRHQQDLTPLVSDDRTRAELQPLLLRMSELDREIFETYSNMEKLDTGAEREKLRDAWKELQKKRDQLVQEVPAFDKAFSASEGQPVNSRIHLKGDPKQLGEDVPRGFLQVLGGQRVPAEVAGSGRLQLAEWITDSHHGLTARVIVNRVWQRHFGQGIVRTPNDFGSRGEPPTHPELLDYLTRHFMDHGWSVKKLHRLIMLSRTYRMAHVDDATLAARDPDNRLLWKFNRRRLDAEELRDAVLAVSGSLDRSRGGRHPFAPEWEWRYTQHRPFVDDFPTNRRSVYVMQQRIRQQPYFDIFDGADTNAATDQRKVSTTAQQSLFLFNSPFVHDQSRRFADRLIRETADGRVQIEIAIKLSYGRAVDDSELRDGLLYLDEITPELRAAGTPDEELGREALASFLRAVLGSNEFAFVE